MDKLKGKLTIGRRGIIGEDYISIELEDSKYISKLVLDSVVRNLYKALTYISRLNNIDEIVLKNIID